MAKLKKLSSRQPAKQRYKIEKKVRDHNRKLRREAKKNPKNKKKQIIQVPNICPFKEDILKEVEKLKKQKEEEKLKLREAARLERKKKKEQTSTIETLISNAEAKGKIYEALTPEINTKPDASKRQENSLKTYYKEFKKVVDAADVVLEVVDARDPFGTRCLQVEQVVKEAASNKRLVIVLNKADLVPRDILDKWLKYLRKQTPAVAFKASTQNQSRKLGQRKFKESKNDKILQNSASVGADLLMSLLSNYCRNKGIKTSIRVGVVGLPNVGKSSIINSLKRSRACNVGATPGITRSMQEVQLDSKIKLLDSPGIVFTTGSDSSSSLRNAVRISSLSDPITPANAILQRVTKQQMMDMYDVIEYGTPEEFYSLKAARTGRFKKGGVPDSIAAARGLLEDWNNGKIKYYTVPPEDKSDDVHVSSAIVNEVAKEFELENFEAMESSVFDELDKGRDKCLNPFIVDGLESVTLCEKMEDDQQNELLPDKINIKVNKKRIGKVTTNRVKKPDAQMSLEGNQKLNFVKKKQFKKEKKDRNRKEKLALHLSENTKDVPPTQGNYDFNVDFAV